MKNLFTKVYYIAAVIILFLGASLPANAQYTLTKIGNNVWASAVATDTHGNVYVVEAATTTGNNDNATVLRYTNGAGTPKTVYSGSAIKFDNVDSQQDDFPAGIAVTSNGDVYVTTTVNFLPTDCSSYNYGAIIRFAYNSGSDSYTESTFLAGTAAFGGFTSLAVDASDNLYALVFDSSGNGAALTAVQNSCTGVFLRGSYEVETFPASSGVPQAGSATRIAAGDPLKLYVNALNSGDTYNNITGLTVDASGNIYVADAFDVSGGSGSDQGHVYKLTKSGGSYIASTYTTGQCTTALGADAAGNVFAVNAPNFWVVADHGPSGFPAFALVEYAGGSTGSTKTFYSALDIGGPELMYVQTIAAVNNGNIFVDDGSEGGSDDGDIDQLKGPSINSITAGSANTNASSVTFTATFSAAVTGVTASNFSLTTSGVSGASISTPTTSNGGVTWSVPVNTGSGDGTIGLNLANSTSLSLGISTALPFTGGTTTVDKTAPTIGIGSPSVSTIVAGSGSVTYTVTYGDAHFNSSTLGTGNISLNASGASGTIGVSGSGTTRTVTISSITGAGTLGISIAAGTASDLAGNTAPSAGPSGTFTVTAPSTTISSLSAVTSTLTNATSVQYTATFAASITGLSTSNFALITTGSVSGASVSSVSGSGTSWTVTVNTGSGDGTIQLSLNNATSLSPSVSNVPFSGDTYTIDKTGPAVTISAPSVTIANSSASISYTVTWTDPNLNSASLSLSSATIKSHLTLTGSVTANPTVSSLPASSSTYTVTFTNVTGDGTLAFTVPAGSANDFAGNSASASSVSTAFTVDNTAPTIGIGAPSASITATNSVTYTVTYGDANFNSSTLGTGNITLNKTNTANGTVGVSGSGTTRTVTISGITGDGTLGISIASGTATDFAGNSAPSAGPSTTFTVDNTAPTIGIGSPSVSTITTGSGSVTYTVTYGDANFNSSTLGTGDITLNSTGDASGTVGVSGSGNTRTVTISSITGSGTLGISIAAGTATDLAGNSAPASAASTTFSVTLIPENITFNALPTTTYGDADFPPGATSDNPNVPIMYGSDHFAVAFVTAGKIHIVGAGTAHITAIQAGDATHSAATNVTQTLTVNMAPLTITADDQTSVHFQPLPTLTASYSGFVYSDNSGSLTTLPTIGTTAVQSSPVGTYPITAINAASSNYSISYVAGTMHITPAGISTLANLTPNHNATLAPVFAAGTTSYTSNVPYSTDVLSITPACDTTATVTVNSATVSSGTASLRYPMSVGANTLTIVVTADDATTTTYTLTVTRAPSPNSFLSNLRVGNTTLSPTFNHLTNSYTATVANGISTIKVTPTAADAGATIAVNTAPVSSGTASNPIPLVVGANTINTVVTAADGTTNTYTVIVTRSQSPNANLSSLKINGGAIALTPSFTYTTTSYTANATHATQSVKITPAVSDATATVKVNTVAVASGTASTPITIVDGPNTITTVVTAQDGSTKTYTIILTRATGPIANPDQSVSVEKPVSSPQFVDDGIVVHQGVSPNGDGINDVLVIEGITAYPENKLMIMKRNGVLIYEAKGYDNSTKIFDGHSNKNGTLQLPGTYFYSLDYSVKGVTKHKTGFIVLKY